MKTPSDARWALQAQHLNVLVGGQPLVRDAQVRLAMGSWVGICGPNGAGKSTLLKALAQLTPCTGQVQWFDQPAQAMSPAEFAKRVSWMGQAQPVPWELSVREVVELGRWPHRQDPAAAGGADADVVQQCLVALGLQALADRCLSELSGGECQRALLARAMAVQAPVMLFDEPLNHLDLPYQHQWLTWLRRRCQQGAAALTVMHELNQAMAADLLWVMREGQVLHQGAPQDPLTQEALQHAFGLKLQFHCIDTQETPPRWVVWPAADS